MPLSPNVETMINQAGSVVVEHVAKKNALDLSDDAALRDWTKRFADLVVRIHYGRCNLLIVKVSY